MPDSSPPRSPQRHGPLLAGTFLTPGQVRQIQDRFGTPVYVYDLATLVRQARSALAMPNAFGLTVRYAIKAWSNAAVLRLFDRLGLHYDASSGYEVRRALRAGVAPHKIQLTAQEVPRDLQALVKKGLRFNASSLRQLAIFGRLFPGRQLSIRINPGLGSGHSRRTNVGGPASGFGIWHEHLADVHRIQKTHDLQITRLHSHVGSGADPATWQHCAALTLRLARHLPQVHTVNLGGGFKVARMPGEADTDLEAVGQAIARQFRRFRDGDPHKRELHLEIEPGAYLVAQAGALITTVVDVKDTGPQGYRFIVVDGGMNDLLRPGLYGAQHPLHVVPARDESKGRATEEYVVVGHCCESGDILTPAPGDPERLQPRALATPHAGDALLVGGTGAYASSMSTVNYNSFPRSPELLLARRGEVHVIRRRQTLEDMVADERLPDLEPWFTDGTPTSAGSRLTWQEITLKLYNPFRVSYGASQTRQAYWLRLHGDEGWGEGTIPPYYGVERADMERYWQSAAQRSDPFPQTPREIAAWVGRDGPAPARAALDLALHDRLGRLHGVPLHRLLDLPPPPALPTAVTVGIDRPQEMARQARELADYPILKIKLGSDDDAARLAAVRRARPHARLYVDANAAWRPQEAVERLQALIPHDLELVEQPVAGDDLEGMGFVQSQLDVPVVADESLRTIADLERLAAAGVQGINVKLMKVGGLAPALHMMRKARELGLRIMLGCMIETSLGVTAMAHLTGFAHWLDLDAPLLIANDPFQGVTYDEQGTLHLPARPGIGVVHRQRTDHERKD